MNEIQNRCPGYGPKRVAQDKMPRCGWFQNIGSGHNWPMGYLLIETENHTALGMLSGSKG